MPGIVPHVPNPINLLEYSEVPLGVLGRVDTGGKLATWWTVDNPGGLSLPADGDSGAPLGHYSFKEWDGTTVFTCRIEEDAGVFEYEIPSRTTGHQTRQLTIDPETAWITDTVVSESGAWTPVCGFGTHLGFGPLTLNQYCDLVYRARKIKFSMTGSADSTYEGSTNYDDPEREDESYSSSASVGEGELLWSSHEFTGDPPVGGYMQWASPEQQVSFQCETGLGMTGWPTQTERSPKVESPWNPSTSASIEILSINDSWRTMTVVQCRDTGLYWASTAMIPGMTAGAEGGAQTERVCGLNPGYIATAKNSSGEITPAYQGQVLTPLTLTLWDGTEITIQAITRGIVSNSTEFRYEPDGHPESWYTSTASGTATASVSSESLSIEKWLTYGGLYDESTGEPVGGS